LPRKRVLSPVAEDTATLTLILPGLHNRIGSDEINSPLPALCSLLGNASCSNTSSRSFEHQVALWFNPDARDDCAAATGFRYDLDGTADTASGRWFRADPVYQQIDMNHATLVNPAQLDLQTSESQALCNSLDEYLHDHGISLHFAAAQRWYLQVPDGWSLQSTASSAAIGRDVASLRVRGADARRWRTIQAELEMLLFEHPVNQQRQQRGQLPVNTLWLWGEGDPAATFEPATVQQSAMQVIAEDHYTCALLDWMGLSPGGATALTFEPGVRTLYVDTRLQEALQQGDLSRRQQLLETLEQQLFAPVWHNLSSARWQRLQLHSGERCFSVDFRARSVMNRLRAWRNTPQLVQYTVAGDA